MKNAIFIFLAIWFVSIASGASSTNAPLPVADQSTAQSDSAAKLQIDYQNQEIQLLKDFQTRIFQTVYWALGVVCTLGLALFAFNWFIGSRLYEKDKEALKLEVLNQQKQALLELEVKIVSQLTATSNSLTEKFQNFNAEVTQKLATNLRDVDNKYAGFSQGILEKFNKTVADTESNNLDLRGEMLKILGGLRSDIEQNFRTLVKSSVEDVETRLGTKFTKSIQDIEKKTDSIQSTSMIAFIRSQLHEGEKWGVKDRWGAAYSEFLIALDSAIKIDDPSLIYECVRAATDALDHGAELSEEEKIEAREIIKQLENGKKFTRLMTQFSKAMEAAPVMKGF